MKVDELEKNGSTKPKLIGNLFDLSKDRIQSLDDMESEQTSITSSDSTEASDSDFYLDEVSDREEPEFINVPQNEIENIVSAL